MGVWMLDIVVGRLIDVPSRGKIKSKAFECRVHSSHPRCGGIAMLKGPLAAVAALTLTSTFSIFER